MINFKGTLNTLIHQIGRTTRIAVEERDGIYFHEYDFRNADTPVTKPIATLGVENVDIDFCDFSPTAEGANRVTVKFAITLHSPFNQAGVTLLDLFSTLVERLSDNSGISSIASDPMGYNRLKRSVFIKLYVTSVFMV